jgi:vitamin B12 transporter
VFLAQAVLLAALATPAPSPSPTASPLATIGGVTTTAERHATTSTAQTTYVVTRAQMEAEGNQTIADAIRNVPGMTVYQFGGFGAEATYGALGSNQSIVLLDGLPITQGSSGSIDLGTLSTSDVDRVEIVESGGSTLYGSGGAGGVINIITSVPRATYLFTSYGSYGDRDVRVSTGNGTIGVSFERHVATNDFPYVAQNGVPAGVRENAQAMQSDGTVDYAQTFGQYAVRATARFTELGLGVPGPVLPGMLTPTEFDPSNRNDLFAEVSRVDDKFTTSFTVGAFRDALFDNGTSGLGPEDAITDSRINASLKEVVSESRKDTLVAGIDLSRESALDILGQNGPPPSFSAAQSQNAVYAQQTIGVGPSGKVYGGLRAENDTPAGGTLEPSAGFVLPVGNVRVGANAASSFIVPTLFDLYFPNFSNPNLLPERDRNLNVVVTSTQVPLAPTLTIFDRTATNLITDNDLFIPVNEGRAHFQGATLSIAPRLFPQLTTLASITDLPIATQVNNGIVGRVDEEPILQGTLSIEKPIASSKLGYGVTGKIAGAHTESFTGPGTFGQYSVFSAYVRRRVAQHAILTARIDDIGDVHYSTLDTFPVPARTYRLELSTR